MKVYKRYKSGLDGTFAPAYKIWSNGIPLKVDTYQSCANFCRYCYAEELRKAGLGRLGIVPDRLMLRTLDVKKFADFVNGAFRGKTKFPFMAWSLLNKKYIELGTTGEVFQEADLDTKVTENFFRIASECELPLFINLKGNLLCRNERYQRMIQDYKAPIIFQVSFTTTDDKMGKILEPLAPLPSERLKTFKEFSKLPHVFCTVYVSPFMPGVTDVDTEKFITDLVSHQIIGGHVRDFFIQGSKFFNTTFWKDYMDRNAKDLEAFPGGYHVTRKSRLKFMAEATKIGVKLNPDFRLVGLKTKFFDVDANWGKMVYDVLDDRFKAGILDFTLIPILRKIKRSGEPQLLLWDRIGYKKDAIEYPPMVNSREGNADNLITTTICINASELNFNLDGFEWLKKGLWNGFLETPSGFIAGMEGMYPVKHKGEYYKVEGDYVYAYIPPGRSNLLSGEGLSFDTGLRNRPQFVNYDVAKTFLVPERLGGTEDKWITREELTDQNKRLEGVDSED